MNVPQQGNDDEYANIRTIIGSFIGKKIIEITQHDEQEWQETGQAYVELMFEDGSALKFYIGDNGFDILEVGQEVQECEYGTGDDTEEN